MKHKASEVTAPDFSQLEIKAISDDLVLVNATGVRTSRANKLLCVGDLFWLEVKATAKNIASIRQVFIVGESKSFKGGKRACTQKWKLCTDI
jgi:hypothetical protein